MTKFISIVLSLLAIGFFAALLLIFTLQSLPVWRNEGTGYLTGTIWYFRTHQFGLLPMIYGTVVVAAVALFLAAPVGIATAIFTAEYLPRDARLAVKVLIESLAGIPSVIYGLLGILLLREWIY